MSPRAATATLLVLAGLASVPPTVAAQESGGEAPPEQPTEEPIEEPSEIRRLEAARRAFDRGTAYALSEDYGRAAAQFETAYRLVPNASALERAMQAHLRASHVLRATSLALRLVGAHPEHEARAAADEVLRENAPSLVRVELDCEPCILAIDGRVRSFHDVMVEPDTDHAVTIERGEATRSMVVRGAPGEHLRLSPPAPDDGVQREDEPPPILRVVPEPAPAEGPLAQGTRMPLEPWVFGVGVGLTVVSAAILIWSGVDTLAGVDDFNRMPTRRAFEEGEAKEARTNVLIAVTSALGALSVLAAFLTDWDGAEPPAAGVWLEPDSAGAWLRGRF